MENGFAWAVGLFEGEGCITHGGQNQRLELVMTMTDLDVVLAFRDAVGCGKVYGPYLKEGRKPIYRWVASLLDAEGLLLRMRPWLSSRRAAIADKWVAGKLDELTEYLDEQTALDHG